MEMSPLTIAKESCRQSEAGNNKSGDADCERTPHNDGHAEEAGDEICRAKHRNNGRV